MEHNNHLEEIQALINIKEYLDTAVNNYSIPKVNLKELHSLIACINQKILSILTNEDFKSYINFENADSIMKKAAQSNNIVSQEIQEKKMAEKNKFVIPEK